jgi:hypothetical protein
MTSQISDLTKLSANMPVLCIPRVHRNIDETSIRKIFNDLNMGILDRIDIVIKRNDNKRNDNKDNNFNRVFIHFREWNDSENAQRARERLLEGKEIKIIYDDPWFWKVSAYKEGELRPNKRTQTK